MPVTVNGKSGPNVSLTAADVPGSLTQTTADGRYILSSAASGFVKTTTDQSIAGVKTFTQTPVVPGGKVVPLDWVNVKTLGAVGDGVANDRAAIQAAIDAVSTAGGGVVYLPRGTYRIGSALLPTNATGVQIVGAGWSTSIKITEGMNDYAFKFDGTDTRMTFANLTIDGNCTAQTAGGGIYGIGAVQCLFQNVHFVGCYDWGLYLGPQTGNVFGHNNKVTNCLFDNALASAGIGGGIYMTSNDENSILACDFEYLGGAGAGPAAILDKAGTQFITACNFVNGGNGCVGVRIQDCTSTRVTTCNFDGTSGDSIFIAATRCNIVANTIFSPGMAGTPGTASGIHLEYGTKYNVVNSNTIASAPAAGGTRSLIREEAMGDAGLNSIQGNTLITAGSLSVAALDCHGVDSIIRGNIGAGPTGDAGFLTQAAGDTRYLASTAAAGFVATTGDQTVGGVKTFSQAPKVPGGPVNSMVLYNVKAYGAIGNGIADDTAAIQNAINAASAAGGGTVYLPTGTYKITAELTLANHITLLGDGDFVTEIKQTSTTANGLVGSSLIYITIRALRLTGPGSGTGRGIAFTTEFDYCLLEDVTVTDWGLTGIDIEQPIVSNFTRVTSRLNGGAGFYIHGTGLGAGTSLSMDSCWARDNVSNGFSFYNMTYCAFVACAADNQINAGKAGYLFDTCVGMSLIGCGSENNNVGVKFSGGGTHTVNGFFNYANPATGVGFWVTGGASNVHLIGVNESSPVAGASKWIQVDSGCTATVRGSIHSTADQFAAGTTISISNSAGVEVVAGSRATGQNTTLGAMAPLGDNGVGVTQVADVTTAPSTNPTGGVTLYAESGTSVPLKFRDASGNVRGVARGSSFATADQTSVGTALTASTFLTASVQANAVYLVEALVYWTTANTATVTTSWTGPAGATMIWGDTTTGGDIVTTLGGVSPAWATGTKLVRIFGTLVTAGTAGTLGFTFASSVAASVTVKSGSGLILDRIK
ncbi:glycosyl hydrolase family 28-related protein [Streptomyces sp. NPDC005551]|uniref:glycosyl hydrolase family 28-related protein n=1 Tax=Streptomyces sp. NPDC005551 TaxID=3364725 RepID=UPI0036BDD06E